MPKKRKSGARSRTEKKNLEEKLIENLISLQKVHLGLTEKFDSLSKQISQLLALFEMAARSFANNPAIKGTEKDKEFIDKIDKLLDQNKTLAKGLMLMEGRIRERMYTSPTEQVPVMEKKTDEFQASMGAGQRKQGPNF